MVKTMPALYSSHTNSPKRLCTSKKHVIPSLSRDDEYVPLTRLATWYKPLFFGFGCALLLLVSQATFAQSFDLVAPEKHGFSSDQFGRLDAHMQQYVDEGKLAGLITLVAHQGDVLHFASHGMQDLAAQKPMPKDGIFRIASMTKPFATVALLMLQEDGLLHIDDPVANYIPAYADLSVYVSETERAQLDRAITIKDMIMHTSGMASAMFPRMNPIDQIYQESAAFSNASSVQELAEAIPTLPLAHQPGKRWTYSFGQDIAARIVEIVSGMEFGTFVQTRILEPLEMNDTSYHLPAEKEYRLASRYAPPANPGEALRPLPRRHTSFPRGATGLHSTALDYLHFTQMLLNGGELNGVRLLQPESVKLMATNHLSDALLPYGVGPLKVHGYGFGLGVAVKMDSPEQASTMGTFFADPEHAPPPGSFFWPGSQNTYFWIDPVNDLIGIFMTQYTGVGEYDFLAEFQSFLYPIASKQGP